MIDLLNSLEYRSYVADELIANELDECHELLFVQQGKYCVGYQINNKVYYRKELGKYSIIGGVQIMFHKRFQFLYKCISRIQGLAIRKERFLEIMDQWPIFSITLKCKFWNFYATNIYWRLSQRKKVDIMDHKFRHDFNQVLSLEHKGQGHCHNHNNQEKFIINNIRSQFFGTRAENFNPIPQNSLLYEQKHIKRQLMWIG